MLLPRVDNDGSESVSELVSYMLNSAYSNLRTLVIFPWRALSRITGDQSEPTND
ncbi:MAG: hypothetical protein PHU85_09035 [Phycisphaerae bacterium]|nr:hypothetical protein [Phycisphaerae bacterium]